MAFQEHGGIVVYRSRAEAEIDKMIWDNPDGAAIFGTVMLIALCSLFAYRFIEQFLRRKFGTSSNWYRFTAWPTAIALGFVFGKAVAMLLGWLILAI